MQFTLCVLTCLMLMRFFPDSHRISKTFMYYYNLPGGWLQLLPTYSLWFWSVVVVKVGWGKNPVILDHFLQSRIACEKTRRSREEAGKGVISLCRCTCVLLLYLNQTISQRQFIIINPSPTKFLGS